MKQSLPIVRESGGQVDQPVRFGSFGLSRRCGSELRQIGMTLDLPDRPIRLSETKTSHSAISHCVSCYRVGFTWRDELTSDF